MFTGIIEEVGKVNRVIPGSRAGEIEIKADVVLEGTKIGDSIAVNGVCLTVTGLLSHGFTADVMPETLRRSNLGQLSAGDSVDLERAMPADGRFGGHIVSGHIDGTGRITELRREENALWIRISAEARILQTVVEKGSIAIDGISLTVAAVSERDFCVSVIPHTAANTILPSKSEGSRVNLECDIIGKYVQKLMGSGSYGDSPEGSGGLTMEFLAEHGF